MYLFSVKQERESNGEAITGLISESSLTLRDPKAQDALASPFSPPARDLDSDRARLAALYSHGRPELEVCHLSDAASVLRGHLAQHTRDKMRALKTYGLFIFGRRRK